MTDPQSSPILKRILDRKSELLAELGECEIRATLAQAEGSHISLRMERERYHLLRQQAFDHSALCRCVVSLTRWLSNCAMLGLTPDGFEIKEVVHTTCWFYASQISSNDIELLINGVIEHIEEQKKESR